ncbi:uncharacterized protein LOC113749852 [Coffea eugenioides]|uniref:uncharacterized protein LOC113749852 n=1 Tax=Coffea eugenioides TaxID=49369 RepID=UPI000F606B01|nr:uncharacterized protein LOC113749852 [Coffea eugenioides]
MSIPRQEEPPNTTKRCKCLSATLKDAFSNCRTHHEESSDPSKRCKFRTSTLRDAFSDCHTFRGRLSSSTPEDDHLPYGDYDDEEIFVSAIISTYMESKISRNSGLTVDNFSWALSPETRELFVTPKPMHQKGNDDEPMDDYFSPHSRLSRCSTVSSMGAFASAKTAFTRSSSLGRIDFQDFWRRHSIIQELSHCQGWPFGLCRKALLLPPLPKSPSDSWLWRKSTGVIKIL